MSDSAEFEKLTMLEARLAAALDRIASGLASGATASVPMDDPGLTSAAMEDAQARADAAEDTAAQWAERAEMLEAQLADAQAQLEAASDGDGGDGATLVALTAERDTLSQRVEALEAARQADKDEAKRMLAVRDDEIAMLKAGVAAARAEGANDRDDAPVAEGGPDMSEDHHVLQMRIKRLKRQRGIARGERDQALDTIEELDRNPGDIDTRIAELRRELVEMRVTNADLVEQLSAMNEASVNDMTTATIVEGLVTELHALQDARTAEAAELERILADLGPLEPEEKAHA